MSVSITSIESYMFNDASGIIGERQKLILEAIKKVPLMTALEYAKYIFHADANFVRPRITELSKMDKIRSSGVRVCSITGRNAKVWEVLK